MTFNVRLAQSWIARAGFVRVRERFPIRSDDGRKVLAHGRETGGAERIVNPGADFRAPGADRVGMPHTKL
jgi:hypothetical protein